MFRTSGLVSYALKYCIAHITVLHWAISRGLRFTATPANMHGVEFAVGINVQSNGSLLDTGVQVTSWVNAH